MAGGPGKPSGMARGNPTDEEWCLIELHLPPGERGPIPDLRRLFNAVMWRFRTGSPWRVLPAEYEPWSTAYDRLRSCPLRAADAGDDRRLRSSWADRSRPGQRRLHHRPRPPFQGRSPYGRHLRSDRSGAHRTSHVLCRARR
ncbi:transposase [Nonomuraea deserti]|uniref:Transposase n=1 Tax=Nonomuraea deserti TaxID=1848322 RepID=A0A4R4VAC3_9ACTN|nr:transposase [Nonomuraea deserti]